jgi:KUP system potassium uptake protein
MITSSFQLLSQVMNLSYFPHIKTVHTSKSFHGQVYMPFANWLLMIGTVIVTAVYNNTTSLGNAYGVCVIIVTFITTCMVSLVALMVWRLPAWLVLPAFLVFASLDGVYLSASLIKVPDGAWFTLLLAVILSSIFILWRFGKEQQWSAEAQDRFPPSHLLVSNSDGESHLTPTFGGARITTVDGVGIFFDKIGDMVPIVFQQFARKFAARPEIIVFFHMRPLSLPSVPEAERYVLSRTTIPSCYRLTIRHGYADAVVTPDLSRLIVQQLVLFVTRDDSHLDGRDASSASSKTHSPEIQAELDAIERAWERQTVYVMGKEQMVSCFFPRRLRCVILSRDFWAQSSVLTWRCRKSDRILVL